MGCRSRAGPRRARPNIFRLRFLMPDLQFSRPAGVSYCNPTPALCRRSRAGLVHAHLWYGGYVWASSQPHSAIAIRQVALSSECRVVRPVPGLPGDDDITTGDLWSKCWLHRNQQIFQFGFGPNGPAPIILAQANEVETLIHEEDGDRPVHVGLPGFKWMPPLIFGNVNLASTLWARLEVRFDIQTEGAGSLLWLDPEVIIRTFQWPLVPR
jgi:hypothetical protein